ncbi:hypothetical protein [Chitinophaga oryzae]|uniref:hypothetical protein n=1 Tax=Chitinophaga oryzae TaxID=2725414 RepID=UPI00144932B6|nr:hypothetical protein [Chitinophaga oryzae]
MKQNFLLNALNEAAARLKALLRSFNDQLQHENTRADNQNAVGNNADPQVQINILPMIDDGHITQHNRQKGNHIKALKHSANHI